MRTTTSAAAFTNKTSSSSFRTRALRAAALATTLAAAALSYADTGTWTGAVDSNWGTAGNWIGGVPNAGTDDAFFYDSTANTANLNVSLGANRVVRSLNFNASATSPVTLNISNAAQLTLAGGVTGGDVVVSAGDHKILGVSAATVQELRLGGSTTWNIAAGSLEVSARMIQNSSSNSLTKTGTGALIFSADQTSGTAQNLGGGYLVTQGTLVFAQRKAVGNTGTPVNVSSGATVEWRNFNGQYNGTNGTFTLQDGARLLVTGATATMAAGNGQLFLPGGNATVETAAQLTINQDINGPGGFTKAGTGLLILGDNGTSTFTGNTVVAAGRLKLSAGATLGNSPSIEVQSAGTFDTSTNASGGLKSFQVLGGSGHVTGAANFTAGALAPGMPGVAGTLTFDTSLTLSGASLALDLTSPSSGNDLMAVSGALGVSSPTLVNINRLGSSLPAGTYTVATYGSLATDPATTAANLVLPAVRQGLSVVDPSTTPGSIQITAGSGSAASLVWTGSASSSWNRSDSNFTNSGSPDKFYDWDDVTFGDSSSVTSVDVPSLITPGNVTFSNGARNYTLSGSGTLNAVPLLTKNGTGNLTLSLASASINTLAVNAGSLTLANSSPYAITTLKNAATVNVGDGSTSGAGLVAVSTTINNSGTVVLNRPDDFTFAGSVSGSGTLAKNGAGTATLLTASAYTGPTLVNAGTLKPVSGSAVGDTSGAPVTVSSGATFDVGANPTTNNFNLGAKVVHIAGSGVGGTAGAIANSGSLTQYAAFNNITLDADALIAGSRIDIGRTSTVPSRTLDLAGHTLTLNMTGTQPIFGILDGTTVTAGNIIVAGGGVDFERSIVADNVGGAITFNANTVAQFYQTTAGAVKRPMAFLGGNSIGSGSTTAAVVNSDMNLQGDVTLQPLASGVPGTGNNPLTLAGVLSGSGAITKAATNTVTLAGNNTYTGATTVSAGTLAFAGSSTGSSALNVADAATASIVPTNGVTLKFGSLNLNSSGTLDLGDGKLVLTSSDSATLLSLITRGYASGAWTGAGLTSSLATAANDPLRIKAIGWGTAASLAKTSFGSVTGLSPTDLLAAQTVYGDLNLDGVVNSDDYIIMDRSFAKHLPASWVNGDLNYDGSVNSADFLLLDTSFVLQGNPLPPAVLAQRLAQFGPSYVAALTAAVPEPATLSLLGVASLVALSRRRRHA